MKKKIIALRLLNCFHFWTGNKTNFLNGCPSLHKCSCVALSFFLRCVATVFFCAYVQIWKEVVIEELYISRLVLRTLPAEQHLSWKGERTLRAVPGRRMAQNRGTLKWEKFQKAGNRH